MHVRFATPNDIEACLQLDSTFDTRRVWQLDLRESREQVAAQLRTATLPRELRLDYPAPNNALLMHWQRGYCLLVAEDWLGDGIVGYADVGPEPDLQTGWLWHLVVDRGHRRQGVGSMLLRAALQWSGDHQLRRLMAPLQTQNDPGVRFLQRHGFAFCGFNDRYFSTGSVALFFGRELR
jgi:GNAT superfamily N-acetyltransferase